MNVCEYVDAEWGWDCGAEAVGRVETRPNRLSNWKAFWYCKEHRAALVEDLRDLMGWEVR